MGGEWVDYVDVDDRPVGRGPRGGAAARGLYYRVAATVLTDAAGRVLVYRRPAAAPVLPGHFDVLVGGSVRAGESYLDAAVRELSEELGVACEPREVWRTRAGSPVGPCWLAVHHARCDRAGRPDPREVAWHGFVPVRRVLDGAFQPFDDVGRRALARLAG
ncbi:NUDIX domain-containing protein [Streptomyces sp. B1866]|uniref:NUDIX domain-containing protein n=1 Tax=Streptomyces sp. B1866 TaxID=3075431 RepID=UPI0028918107|nr:NUDIX domain-containing protein [Streptomyces sp. B1866]MDT3398246.1 NUDIX domain-containing protein [Streptomyces sp. B1866]